MHVSNTFVPSAALPWNEADENGPSHFAILPILYTYMLRQHRFLLLIYCSVIRTTILSCDLIE